MSSSLGPALSAMLFVGPVFAAEPVSSPRCLEVIGTSDFHGHIDGEVRRAAGLQVERGGLGTFTSYLGALRRTYGGRVLLLDAGDLFQGTLISNATKGAAVVAAYETLGYQAAALGNHEFDFGPEPGGTDPQGTIKRRVQAARFPFLASNIYDRATGRRVAWDNLLPSVLLSVGDLKVGVIGAITVDTPSVTLASNVANLEFRDPVPEVIAEVKSLAARGADLMVLVAHIGGGCSKLSDPEDTSSCDSESELFKLVRRLPRGAINIAIGGHTHKFVAHRVNETAIIESGKYGHAFGWVEACVGSRNKISTEIHSPQPICSHVWNPLGCTGKPAWAPRPAMFLGQEMAATDATVESVVKPFRESVRPIAAATTGITLAKAMPQPSDEFSPLGSLIAKAMMQATPEARVAVINAGGIRNGLPAGPIHYGELFEVLPFDNHIVELELTGAQLKAFISAPWRTGHGVPYVAGANVSLKRELEVSLPNGKPVGDDQRYLVVTNDFMATGGDGTREVIAQVPAQARHATSILLRDAVIAYLKDLPQPVGGAL